MKLRTKHTNFNWSCSAARNMYGTCSHNPLARADFTTRFPQSLVLTWVLFKILNTILIPNYNESFLENFKCFDFWVLSHAQEEELRWKRHDRMDILLCAPWSALWSGWVKQAILCWQNKYARNLSKLVPYQPSILLQMHSN